MILHLLLLIAIGGLIGYLTNKVAVRMLFRPIKPRRILFIKVQGLLPKRKALIAESLGITIEEAFLSKDDIFASLLTDDARNDLKALLKTELTQKINKVIPSMFKSMLGPNIDTMIHQFIDTEGDKLIEKLFYSLQEHGTKNLDIPTMVKEKVDEMDFIAFERIVLNVVKKELRYIEVVGLILGMIIGFFQFMVVYFL